MYHQYLMYLLDGDAFMKELHNFLMMNEWFSHMMSRRLYFSVRFNADGTRSYIEYEVLTSIVESEYNKWQDRKLPGYDESKCAWRCKDCVGIGSFMMCRHWMCQTSFLTRKYCPICECMPNARAFELIKHVEDISYPRSALLSSSSEVLPPPPPAALQVSDVGVEAPEILSSSSEDEAPPPPSAAAAASIVNLCPICEVNPGGSGGSPVSAGGNREMCRPCFDRLDAGGAFGEGMIGLWANGVVPSSFLSSRGPPPPSAAALEVNIIVVVVAVIVSVCGTCFCCCC